MIPQNSESTHFYRKCEQAEEELKILEAKFEALKTSNLEKIAQNSTDENFKKLIAENKKLKYRINIMKRAVEEHEKTNIALKMPENKKIGANKSNSSNVNISGYHMVNILGYIEALFFSAIEKIYPDVPTSFNTQVQVSKIADYQCNAAMSLSKVLKKPPKDVGEMILNSVEKTPVISNFELSGPGFINITLNNEFIKNQVFSIIKNGVKPPTVKKKKVVVDFSSPNVAKEMHVGHLRSTIIGDSICRLLEFLGHDVVRINHLGDWGTQFGMLITHLQDKFPNFATESPPIQDLQSFYKESKLRFDEDADFKKRAYNAVVQLQSHQPTYYKAWKLICSVSVKEFQKVYERLGVKITHRGESYYQKMMEKLVKELDEKTMLSLEDGRKVMYAEGADVPLTVVKSDGGFTYDTSDMACIKQRIEEEHADWIIYVTDAGQAQHFKSLFACAKKSGIYDADKVRIDHVTFGVVLGEDKKKFKTRSGDTVRLISLLDEGIERAEAKLMEKDRQNALTEEEFNKAKTSVAYGCIKYADLSHDRTRDYIFSFDRMLDFRGNTAAYLLYALTRIRSIARNAGVTKDQLDKEIENFEAFNHVNEIKLAKTILKLPDVLMKLAQELYIHPICEYLYEISTVFTEFYDNCYCIEKDSEGKIVKLNMHRLGLCEVTAIVMEKCFEILGIQTLEKM